MLELRIKNDLITSLGAPKFPNLTLGLLDFKSSFRYLLL